MLVYILTKDLVDFMTGLTSLFVCLLLLFSVGVDGHTVIKDLYVTFTVIVFTLNREETVEF